MLASGKIILGLGLGTAFIHLISLPVFVVSVFKVSCLAICVVLVSLLAFITRIQNPLQNPYPLAQTLSLPSLRIHVN